jgi:hypothetical protein
VNPDFDSFANYGGPTSTMPPQPGSPAIDAGLNGVETNASRIGVASLL